MKSRGHGVTEDEARRLLCPACGYDVTGIVAHMCPECGGPRTWWSIPFFDQGDKKTIFDVLTRAEVAFVRADHGMGVGVEGYINVVGASYGPGSMGVIRIGEPSVRTALAAFTSAGVDVAAPLVGEGDSMCPVCRRAIIAGAAHCGACGVPLEWWQRASALASDAPVPEDRPFTEVQPHPEIRPGMRLDGVKAIVYALLGAAIFMVMVDVVWGVVALCIAGVVSIVITVSHAISRDG